MNTVSQVVQRIERICGTRPMVLVGIDGLGGAGKSILSSELATRLRRSGRHVQVVHFDDFALPTADRPKELGARKPIGGDFDWQRLRDEILTPLRSGRTASYARYDWTADANAEIHEVCPKGVVLIEGVGTCRNELSGFYDLRVWVDCPAGERLRRGIARDGESSRAQWEQDWMPSEERYAAEHVPDQKADLLISGETS